MRNLPCIAIVGLLVLTSVYAQNDIAAKFEFRSHAFQGTTLPYRLFVPEEYDSAQKYPLILALHGAGERGSDNSIHVRTWRLATAWADPVNQGKYPCFVVAPQCPYGRSWTYDFYPLPIGEEMATVVDILDSLLVEFSIDTNRQYVTGLSMGGFGTWDLITRFPCRFAAAVPMSAGGDPFLVDRILHIPVWNFHGVLDDAVPVSGSREMMEALEGTGRTVLYTHCRMFDCRGLPDSLIAVYVESHADLLNTEYEDGGHIIWDESYDYPYLIPWVFGQYRKVPDSIELTNLKIYRTLQGVETIQWTSLHPEESVEIWYSPDAGRNWEMVSPSEPNTGQYEWNTEIFEDCSFGLVKIFLKNSEGFIYDSDQSAYFSIDNEMNGHPFVKILNDEFRRGEILNQEKCMLQMLIGDAEKDSLQVRIFFSADNGHVFFQFDTYTLLRRIIPESRSINLSRLPNSNQSILRIEVTDGMVSAFDETNVFVKNTPRMEGPEVNHVAGSSGGTVTVNIVDQEELTGNMYRITFDATLFEYKIYDVLNIDTGLKVVEGATQLDGMAEGPLFDGIRLIIEDFDPPVVDVENTGWAVGISMLEISVYLPTVNLGTEIVQGVPSPLDYRIILFDHVVDTSSSAFGASEIPMMFTIRNLTQDRAVEVIFLDRDKNQTISRLDELFLLLADGEEPQLTWALFFGGLPSVSNPQPGDMFDLVTRKPIQSEDIYEFRSVLPAANKGDVNHDSSIDALDLFMTVNIILKNVEPTVEEVWAADCNGIHGMCEGDDSIDALDVVRIIRIILGLDECLSRE